MEVLATVAFTVTLLLWHFSKLLKYAAVEHELPNKAALFMSMYMTDQEILTFAVLTDVSLSVLLAPVLCVLSIFYN